MPQSAVYRRRQIDNAKLRGEKIVQKEILPVLQARYKSLSRELREGNLRKRLRKDDGWFEKAKKDNWSSWFDLFDKTLKKSLMDGAGFVWDTELKYFTSMNYPTFPFDGRQVIDAYYARNGTQITNVSADTETRVNQAIADWYKTDAGLPDLIGMLETYFSPTRAELIATTEMAYVASQVAYDMMDNYNIELWQWDAFQDAITCDLCFGLMEQSKKTPFTKSDPMPPDPSHPKCRCGVYFLGVDVNVKKFVVNFNGFEKGGAGSGNWSHSGRIGIRGGSGGGGTAVAGTGFKVSPDWKPLPMGELLGFYEADSDLGTFLDNPEGRLAVAVKGENKGTVLVDVKASMSTNHTKLINSFDDSDTVDNYVRYVYYDGKVRTDVNYASLAEVATKAGEADALDAIFKANDVLTSKGLPAGTPLIITMLGNEELGLDFSKLLKDINIHGLLKENEK